MNMSGVGGGHLFKGTVTLSLVLFISILLAFSGIVMTNGPVQAGMCYMVVNAPPNPVVGQPYFFQFSSTGTGGCNCSGFKLTPAFVNNATIPGLTWSAATGVLSGVPTMVGYSYSGTIQSNWGTGCAGGTPDAGFAFSISVQPDYSQPPAPVTYDFKVKIGPGLTSGTTNVLIDGINKGSPAGGESHTFTASSGTSHVIDVDKTVLSAAGTRFTVKGSSEITVNESNTLAYFDYSQAVLIETKADPPQATQPSGTGWYAVGDNFRCSVPGSVDSSSTQGCQYRFKQWTLPDGNTQSNTGLSFTVSTPGTATALYDTYYLLTISSEYPPISETTWQKSGDTVIFHLPVTEAAMPGFWGLLGGKVKATSPTITHKMDAPFKQNVAWNYDYTMPTIILIVAALVIAGIVFLVLRKKSFQGGTVAVASADSSLDKSGIESTRMMSTKAVTAEKKIRAAAKQTGTVAKKKETAPKIPGATAKKPSTVAEKTTAGESDDKSSFCSKCGSPADTDAGFCKKCGAKL
jgi:hypothetical protein